ncbi:MAG TPA: type II toxin-antitoxin system death-on-curing family toxin [Pyrinomonadaceae bacterium]|jgi:death-on-curing protein|nr:type II toxin-antitoxin system death-on-curing family toxin [Pyrinomonadaceae bacterium]
MKKYEWVSPDTVFALHERQIAEHGGSSGMRDEGLLRSALARPENLYAYGENVDIAVLAASYAFGITKNHPFVDGNKRTAHVVMRTFLLLNGANLVATQADKYIAILRLAEGSITEEELAEWIRQRLK